MASRFKVTKTHRFFLLERMLGLILFQGGEAGVQFITSWWFQPI